MTVINPNSISGITSITLPSGDGNVLTIHTNDGTERFRIDSSGNVKVGSAATISPDGDLFVTGVTTTGGHFAGSGANLTNLPAANVTGTLPAISGANLTNLPAANLTGALPAISGANLTGIAATDNVRTGILDVAGIATFRSDVNISNINGGQIGGRRNLIINGAMNVAQRGTSSTSSGFQTVDRFAHYGSGWDEALTQEQVDVSSGTTPYTNGFRKAFKLTNGNQTGSGGTGDNLYISYKAEAQDLAKSGWNYTSTSSFVTLSFWVKSSVAQNFYGYLKTADGTSQNYPFETGSLSANTWTKITKTIPGNSNLQFDTDTDANSVAMGVEFAIGLFFGTDFTGSITLNQWGAWSSTNRAPDYGTSNDDWYETNDSTFELTGVQLEVGSQATPFEFRSFADDLHESQRYCFKFEPDEAGDTDSFCWAGKGAGDSGVDFNFILPRPLRASPTMTLDSSGGGNVRATRSTSGTSYSTTTPTVSGFNSYYPYICLRQTGHSSMSDGVVSMVSLSSTGISIQFDAEL